MSNDPETSLAGLSVLVVDDEAMRLGALREVLEKILAANRRLQTQMSPVLITREAGTGKSSLARRLGSRIQSRTS